MHGLELAQLISQGESSSLELKSTMQCNVLTGKRDKNLEEALAKTLCGFMNAEGGTLIIGVDDQGNALGLANDFPTLRKEDEGEFELALTDIVKQYLGLTYREYLDLSFENYGGGRICVIQVERSPEPVFLVSGQEREFYVRVSSSTRSLQARETLEYVKEHFEGKDGQVLIIP